MLKFPFLLVWFCNIVFLIQGNRAVCQTADKHVFASDKSRLKKNQVTSASANNDYQRLKNILRQIYEINYTSSAGCLDSLENLSVEYRDFGIECWMKYPTDPRRFAWLYSTLNLGSQFNHYWKDIAIGSLVFVHRSGNLASYMTDVDFQKYLKWQSMYKEFKKELLEYNSQTKAYNPLLLEIYELKNSLKLFRNTKFKELLNIDRKYFLDLLNSTFYNFRSSSSGSPVLTSLALALDYELISGYKGFNLSETDMLHLLTELDQTSCIYLNKWIEQKINLFSLIKTPFEFAVRGLDGEVINSKLLRGSQAIILDFWSTYCSSCIDRMPYLKSMGEKFENDGLKIISVCIEDSTNINKIIDIHERFGAKSDLIIAGNPSAEKSFSYEVWKRFGFKGVPQLLFLDKSGRLIVYNNELLDQKLDDIIASGLKRP